jgi:hypothetical protein
MGFSVSVISVKHSVSHLYSFIPEACIMDTKYVVIASTCKLLTTEGPFETTHLHMDERENGYERVIWGCRKSDMIELDLKG